MTRLHYLYTSVGLVALLSLIGLLAAPAVYQSWIAEQWVSDEWNSPVLDYLFDLEMQQAQHHSTRDAWLPFKILVAAILAPAMPAFLRLKWLGLSPLWGVLGLLPGLNFLIFVFLAIRGREEPDTGLRGVWHLAALALLSVVAAGLFYYLLLYVSWLAAKS